MTTFHPIVMTTFHPIVMTTFHHIVMTTHYEYAIIDYIDRNFFQILGDKKQITK